MQKAFDSNKEKIKVTSLEIIVTGTKDKPYYEIKYKEVGEEDYHTGYSSYDLNNVFEWKEECFEIVNQVAEEYLVGKREKSRDCQEITAHYGCNTNGEHEKCDGCGIADKCPDYKKYLFKQFGNSEQVEVCVWRLCEEEANVYGTSCRNLHILLDGSPTDNNYEFCPYCGKKIKVIE